MADSTFDPRGIEVAEGVSGGGDRCADDELQILRHEVVGVHGEHLVGAEDGHGDDGDLGFDGDVEGTGHGREERAGGRAPAFGEDDDGVSVVEGGDGGVEGTEGGADVGGIDGDLSGAVEVPAEDGEGEEFFFREDAKLRREMGVEQGDIHRGEMVGGIDLGQLPIDVFATDDRYASGGGF